MHCPFCHAEDTKVLDSRLVDAGGQVRRRRFCVQCEERFSTFERAELQYPWVVKRDGRREPFEVRKIRESLLIALQKRPISTASVDAALDALLHRIRVLGDREISSVYLGEQVMRVLRELDHVAYVRFASVYRSFTDVNDFRAELDRLASGTHDESHDE